MDDHLNSKPAPEIQSLQHWWLAHGGQLHPSIHIHWFGQSEGYGFQARQSIERPTEDASFYKVVSCPYTISLSYLNAIDASPTFSRHDSVPFPSAFLALPDHNPLGKVIIGYFFLMQQYLMGEKSFWYPYIRLLPQPNQPQRLGTAILWPEEDLEYLSGTNAEPAVRKYKEIWKNGYSTGYQLLQDHENWQLYTYDLYQWAAAVFGTRSFRPSLTLPEPWGELDAANEDAFSVLYPVLDIGNHMPAQPHYVKWIYSKTYDHVRDSVSLWSCKDVTMNDEVFNNYGSKSNSELLVGYGFMLPVEVNEDTVNLKLAAGGPRSGSRSQAEGMHLIFSRPRPCGDDRPLHLRYFSDGLVNLLLASLANMRERNVEGLEVFNSEASASPFGGHLARSMILAHLLLRDKLQTDLEKLRAQGESLEPPSNHNQSLAMEYRTRQMRVLQNALAPMDELIQGLFSHNSCVCTHFPDVGHNSITPAGVKILSLECAFDWLANLNPSLSGHVESIISQEQEEPLPLDWSVLVADWDHVFWSLWIYLVLLLPTTENSLGASLHGWTAALLSNHPDVIRSRQFFGDKDEAETFDAMLDLIDPFLQQIPSDSSYGGTATGKSTMKSLASFIAMEECFKADFPMLRGSKQQERVTQLVLCLPSS
ncbi:hypothetical protein BP5796_09042 [Coleophoma crateriformis]|uniref:SET domain-containing protein n=1 Tax=Coleophoma crateriformis TaxID=565419 RepID=A0A3D8R2W5_9HELO|nr:hypothetical protein BP5796_09042 [Coleophoma crateriformis]